jgi:hypothetical protein
MRSSIQRSALRKNAIPWFPWSLVPKRRWSRFGCLTGTLLGGYADDIYNLLFRIPTGSLGMILIPSELVLTAIG